MSMNINDAIRVIQNKSPSLSKDELKSLKQSDRKILHSKLSESSLSKKEKANVIQLADKLQKNTFSKYVDGKEYRPSTRGEQVIKGIKQLVGGRISSEKLHTKLHPNKVPKLDLSQVKRAPRDPGGKVVEEKPDPVFKENPKFLTAKEKELKRQQQKPTIPPRSSSLPKTISHPEYKESMENLLTVGDQKTVNSFLLKNKCYKEISDLGKSDKDFTELAKEALRYATTVQNISKEERTQAAFLYESL